MATGSAKTGAEIREIFIGFVITNYLFGDSSKLPSDEESLIELGVVDSTGILELIEFTEHEFGISISDSETIPENLGSIANLVTFVQKKLG
ncbi:MAG: acyl carrier protein [Deltaproteobacteria bacterium]|nr:acyl carrier protein [Deltaproteobacteria bacterium]